MLSLVVRPGRQRPLRLLCLGAHPDDIEIGCSGTSLRLAAEIPDLVLRWIVFSGAGPREAEAQRDRLSQGHRSERDRGARIPRRLFPPFQGADIKDQFEALKREFDPSLVLTHWQGDSHQDHRQVAELTHNTFHDHFVLKYEIPKYNGDLGNPAFFVPLTPAQLQRKVDFVARHFPSKRGRSRFSEEAFFAIARLRGIGCNAPEGLAETFYAGKVVF